jgi:hypothetical protein
MILAKQCGCQAGRISSRFKRNLGPWRISEFSFKESKRPHLLLLLARLLVVRLMCTTKPWGLTRGQGSLGSKSCM